MTQQLHRYSYLQQPNGLYKGMDDGRGGNWTKREFLARLLNK